MHNANNQKHTESILKETLFYVSVTIAPAVIEKRIKIKKSQKVAFSTLHQSVITSSEINSVEGGE